MKKDRVAVSNELFSRLLLDIFAFYKAKLHEIEIEEKDIQVIKKIRDLSPQEYFKPLHGYRKHIFAKKYTKEYYCSVGTIIVHELEKFPEKTRSGFI